MKKIKLGDILTIKRGISLHGKYYASTGKYIRLTLGNFNYPLTGFKYNTTKQNIYYNGHVKQEYILKKDDMITPLTEQTYGLLGQTAFIPTDDLFIQSGDIGLIKPNSKCNKKYVYYLISSNIIKKQLSKSSQQTKIRHTSPSYIMKCIAFVPPLSIQNIIGNLLYNIDALINNKSEIINKLQELSETIYNYWFIQFDFPDEKGRPYKTSGGKMVWNKELRKEIPKDWKVENIVENRLSKTITSGVKKFKTKFYLPTANIDVETIKEGSIVTFDNRESRANMEPKKNSVWFAKMSKSIKHITLPKNSDWFINKYILSTGFVGIGCKEEYLSYIHCVVCTPDFERQKDMLSHGATQKAVNNTDLKKLKLIIPTDNILKKFNKLVYPILTYKISLMQEIQELTSLRDFLLPLLMNGQVGFKESEN